VAAPTSNLSSLVGWLRAVVGWVRTAGIAAVLFGLGPAMIQPTTGSWLIGVAVVYGGLLILALDPWFESRLDGFRKTRIGISIVMGSVIAAFSYFYVFAPAPIGLSATSMGAPYSDSPVIAGIVFKPEFLEVDLSISNPTSSSYNDVDLIIQPDSPVAEISQQTSTPNVTFEPNNIGSVRLKEVAKGLPSSVRIDLLATDAGYRLRCDKILPNSTISVIIAIVEMKWNPQPNPSGSSPDMVRDKNYMIRAKAGPVSYWYGHKDGDIYIDHPTVSTVLVAGTFTSLFKPHSIIETVFINRP
jgi:hypothetical protein